MAVSNRNGINDFTVVDIPSNTHKTTDEDNYHGNKENKELSIKESNREESIENASDNFDIERKAKEDCLRNILFYLDLKCKFLQMLVTSALLILAVEWRCLQQLLQNHVFYLLASTMVLTTIALVNNFVQCFRRMYGLTVLIHTLLYILFFWSMAATSNDFDIFTPYCVVLGAVTMTMNLFFLCILVYFQKASFRGCAIYGYALIVPLLIGILSQPFYFWVHVKFTVYYLIMPYNDYMINVCAGIGLALINNLETIAWMQWFQTKLQYKDGFGIFFKSFLIIRFRQPDATSQPVSL